MKEYNWREERNKYQPDFNKKKLDDTAETAVQQTPAQQPPAEKTSAQQQESSGNLVRNVILALILLVCLCAAAGYFLVTQGDSASDLASAAERYKTAVALVACKIEMANGSKIILPVGTAWAMDKDKFVTNAHVAFGLRQLAENIKQTTAQKIMMQEAKKSGCKTLDDFLSKLDKEKAKELEKQCREKAEQTVKKIQGVIFINGEKRKSYDIISYQTHRDYKVEGSSFEPDLAILTIDGSHNVVFPIAKVKKLQGLKSGTPVAFLGFPMENLNKENVNLDNPVASMQSGIIVAATGFDMKDIGAEYNQLLRHNLPSTGGASGSPMFNSNGEVVGILFAINTVNQVIKVGDNVSVKRAPSGALINFALRADLLNGMDKPVPSNEFLK